jgi:DNA polymerase-1
VRLLVDIETNGLLDRADLKVLCVVARDIDAGTEYRFRGFGHPDEQADKPRLIELLATCELMVGHNIAGFDLPVLERWLGVDWSFRGELYDTRLVSRQRYLTTIDSLTYAWRAAAGPSEAEQEARYPKRLLNRLSMHKLEAWGYRLGLRKGDYLKDHGVQEMWSQELEDYCAVDVQVNVKLFHRLQEPDKTRRGEIPAPPFRAMVVESMFGYLLGQQERNGVGFNVEAATKLYAELCGRRDTLTRELKALVPPWFRPETCKGDPMSPELRAFAAPGDASVKIPKITYKVKWPHNLAGREKGCAFTPVELVEFNPGSREMVADRLAKLYGWKPAEDGWTDGGKTGSPQPVIDEVVLGALDYPIAPLLAEYYTVAKLIGTISEGDNSWLKFVKAGKIHGVVQATGARTSRCSHSKPNLANVPKVTKHPKTKQILTGLAGKYGAECRALFGPTRAGWVQVGVDASGCQLRMLAHRLAYFDGGAFGKVLLEGDPHETWRAITGLYSRENQKTLTYAFLFGAGDGKAGSIVVDDWRQALATGATTTPVPVGAANIRTLGAGVKKRLREQVPGLSDLIKACAGAYERRWVRTLDGRVVIANSAHGVLNDVLQGDEAVLMRHAKVRLHRELENRGLRHGWHYGWLLDVHDEWQFETPAHTAKPLGELAARCIAEAGVELGCRVPMAGEYKVGANWKECH